MKREIKLFAAITICLSMNLVSAQSLEQAKKLTANEQFESAEKVYKQIIVNNPKLGENYFYYGENHYQQENFAKAKKAYEEGIKTNPSNMLNYVGLGKIYWAQGNTKDANTNFHKAKELSKGKDAAVLLELAEAYLQGDMPDADKALAEINSAIKLDDKNPEAYVIRGDAFLQKTNGSEAIANYNKATELDPKSVQGILRIGQLYSKARNNTEAAHYYDQAIAIDPNFAPAYREKGEVYFRAGKADKAAEMFQKYLSLNDDFSARIRYAKVLYVSKKYDEAVKEISKIQEVKSDDLVLSRLLAYSLFELKKYPEGLKEMEVYFEKMLDEDAANIIASDYEYYAKLLSKTGQDSLAAIQMEKALSMAKASGDPEIYFEAGRMFYSSKNYPKAIELFKKNIEMKSSPKIIDRFYLGMATYRNQEFAKADSIFEEITALAANYPNGYLWRGKCNAQLDPENKEWLAKPHYIAFIEKAKGEPKKNDNGLIEAYSYMGYYYYMMEDFSCSKASWLKIQELDPANEKAVGALKDDKINGGSDKDITDCLNSNQ